MISFCPSVIFRQMSERMSVMRHACPGSLPHGVRGRPFNLVSLVAERSGMRLDDWGARADCVDMLGRSYLRGGDGLVQGAQVGER